MSRLYRLMQRKINDKINLKKYFTLTIFIISHNLLPKRFLESRFQRYLLHRNHSRTSTRAILFRPCRKRLRERVGGEGRSSCAWVRSSVIKFYITVSCALCEVRGGNCLRRQAVYRGAGIAGRTHVFLLPAIFRVGSPSTRPSKCSPR